MSSEEAVYIMQSTDEEWVSPTPVGEAIAEALRAETDVGESALETIDFDPERVAAVLGDEDDTVTVTVADHDVTVHSSGDIDVD